MLTLVEWESTQKERGQDNGEPLEGGRVINTGKVKKQEGGKTENISE